MALLETLTIGVGAAVANSALKLWLKDSEIAAAAATTTVDILAKMLPFEVQRPAQREFERIADEVGSNLERFLEAECPNLAENEMEAASHAVADALNRAAISNDLLFAKDLDPLRLERHVLEMVPDADRDLSGDLYPRILRESCNYVIEITSTLPGFGLRAVQETLRREGEIAARSSRSWRRCRAPGAAVQGTRAMRLSRASIDRTWPESLTGYSCSESPQSACARYGLSVAYITLSAARPATVAPEADEADEFATEPDEEDDASFTSLPVDEALAASRRVLIRGEAGSGKTTLLQWLAVQSARNAFTGALEEWNAAVPFFIQLRRWVGQGLPQPEEWLTYVASAIRGAMPNGWVHRQLQSGALVLIDGVDELPDSDRAKVREWLQNLVANAKATRFIVTTRPAAAEEGWLRQQDFEDSQLQSMEPHQVEALIDQWHLAAHKQTTDEEILDNLEGYRDSLKRVIQSDRAIRSLATTPLLCAMLCLLNVDRRTKIPKDRMALYRIALETLARREIETDWAGSLDLTERQRELALEELAYWLIRNDLSDATRAQVEAVVADKLPQLAYQNKQVVRYLLERSGLLREPVIDRIDFIHRAFQEYLAAKRIIAAQDVGILLSHAHEPSWREVVILATGHASDDCEIILQALLERADNEPSHRHYLSLLAVSCLETATAFSNEIRGAIENRLAELVPPTSMSEAKALASAGEIAVPYLAGHKQSKAQYAAACVRALAMIGGEASLKILEEYAEDRRISVGTEVFRSRSSFPDEIFDQRILTRLNSVRITSARDYMMVPKMTDLEQITIESPVISDLKPLQSLNKLQFVDIFGATNVWRDAVS